MRNIFLSKICNTRL